MAAASVIVGLTALPQALLLYVGVGLVPSAALMALTAVEPAARGSLVRLVIFGNMLWVVGSVLMLLSPWIARNALGAAFVVVQALAVAAVTWLERVAPAAYEVGSQAASSRSRVKAPASVR